MGSQESTHIRCDFRGVGFERKMRRALENMQFGSRHTEHEITPAPNDESGRLVASKVRMPFFVTIEIGGVIGVQCVLDIFVAGPIHSPLRMPPRIGTHLARIRHPLEILALRIGKLECRRRLRLRVCGVILGQIRQPVMHFRRHPFPVRVRILDDERSHALRTMNPEAEPDRPTEVLHVQRVGRKAESVCKLLNDPISSPSTVIVLYLILFTARR
jgi:hypothetical protein